MKYQTPNSTLSGMNKSFQLLPVVQCPLLLLSTSQIHFHTQLISFIHSVICSYLVNRMVESLSI